MQADVFQGMKESGPYSNNMMIEIVFGIKRLNQEDNKLWEPESLGILEVDEEFNPTTAECQLYLI